MQTIRTSKTNEMPLSHKLLNILMMFVVGVIVGIIAKYLDTIAVGEGDIVSLVLSVLGNVGTELGLWIFLGTIITIFSRSAKAAAMHLFSFLSGMLISYYVYSMILFGFFPTSYFLLWSGIAIVSPLGAYLLWYGRGSGYLAAIVGAIPIALLLKIGYPFFYTFEFLYVDPPILTPLVQLFNIGFAINLYFLMYKTKKQKIKGICCVLGIALLLGVIPL